MARPDIYESWRGACPCGQGEVVQTVTDYNKMYAKADIEIRCSCEACSQAYMFRKRADLGMIATPRDGGDRVTLEPSK